MIVAFRPLAVIVFALVLVGVPALIAERPAFAQDTSSPADNSAQNKHINTTADQQSNAKADRLITAKVRKAILADKSLSAYAHNVKIVTRNGSVTLEGPVKSDDEKQKVASDAASVISQDKLVDQLTVK